MIEKAKSVVEISETELDKECIKLPSDFLFYAGLAADCRRDVQELKAKMDVVEADLSKKIRDEPAVYGIEKVTESAINAVILTRKEYKQAQSELFAKQHDLDIAQAVVFAMEHKKRALTMLVELHGQGWFANVKMSAKGKEAVEEMTKGKVRRRWQED